MWPTVIIVSLLILSICLVLIAKRTGLWTWSHQRGRQAGMETAWQSWLTNIGMDEVQRRVRADLLNAVNDDIAESVHKSLLEFEASLRIDAKPMLRVRRELMDSIDRRQLNSEILKLSEDMRANLRRSHPEILQTDETARAYIFANELRIAVLREYAGLRYGDCADSDWFAVYQKASRLRQRSTRNYIERALGGTQSATDDARFHTMTLMDSEIRTRLLQVPPGTRFPGFGKAPEQSSEPA